MRDVNEVAMSPDGHQLAWVVETDGKPGIMLADANGQHAHSIGLGAKPGTCSEEGLAWAPDSRHLAFLSNCRFPGRLQAAVSFYGGAIAPDADPDRFGRTPPIGEASKMQAPMFLGYGADDQGIPGDEHARIAKTLTDLKKRYVLSVYPGAGHAFLCEERKGYAPKVEPIAWRESIEFLKANLG